MSTEHDEGEQFFYLDPQKFSEVSRSRARELVSHQLIQLKALAMSIYDVEMYGEEKDDEEQLQKQFNFLLNTAATRYEMVEISRGLSTLEGFADDSAMQIFQTATWLYLNNEGYTGDEIVCGVWICLGYFSVDDLEKE